MFNASFLSLQESGVLNKLVSDYLSGKEDLKKFYRHFPDKKGFESFIEERPYHSFERNTLVAALETQSTLTKNFSETSKINLAKLKDQHTFTVTTGHQLCLFTGPLYFIYKIITTIRLAEELKKTFPSHNFVPVYWMASEDHDFAEVNHFINNGRRITWQSTQEGAVGKFNTDELRTLLPEIKETLGVSENSRFLIDLFENAYLRHKNLADATRFIVNELFGSEGIIVVDGDDPKLKTLFIKEFKNDIFENSYAGLVTETDAVLEKLHYKIQVYPREINCFFLEEGSRVRIEKVADAFRLVGKDKIFSPKELKEIVERTPEKISPNVVLRPLYQQKILPNIAYVGGPGEIAYWLQFQKMFDSAKIVFPILLPRNSAMIVSKETSSNIKKLGLDNSDLFKPADQVMKMVHEKKHGVFQLDAEVASIRDIYNKIGIKTGRVDPTLQTKVAAELQKALNAIATVVEKSNRALRRRSETELNRLKTVLEKLFPGGVPQERYENFSGFFLKHGKSLFPELKKHFDPFRRDLVLLTEESPDGN
jgi:bacillithiol biosynthesis cysteine-adding enzyme BshC